MRHRRTPFRSKTNAARVLAKTVICKTETKLIAGTLANSADIDQTRRLIRFFTICVNCRKPRVKVTVLSPRLRPLSKTTFTDNLPTPAVSV